MVVRVDMKPMTAPNAAAVAPLPGAASEYRGEAPSGTRMGR